MSAAASWSYSAKATLWPLLSRADWSGALRFGLPLPFNCDYKAEAKRMTDAKGVEFTSRQLIYTERADIKPGDRVLIGASGITDPTAAGAVEVRSVSRFADTFDRRADDFLVVT